MATTPSTQLTVDDPHAGHDHGGDGHAHEAPMLVGHDGQLHPSNLQHFFVSSEQQFEASKLGMWLFLATEILLFGGMFVAYGIFRVLYPEVYEAASLQLDTVLGATNTLVLLLSSLTMAWAIRGAQMDNRKVLVNNLIATMVLASAFLVVKYFEYSHKFHEGIYPGQGFVLHEGTASVSDLNGATPLTPIYSPPAPHHEGEEGAAAHEEVSGAEVEAAEAAGAVVNATPAELEAAREAAPDLAGNTGEAIAEATASVAARAGATTEAEPLSRAEAKEEIFFQRRAGIFFSIYYVMTGIHAIHILIGIIAIGFLTVFSMKGRYSSVWYTPVENVGLYWHIVDIIWIFVFPLMYLI